MTTVPGKLILVFLSAAINAVEAQPQSRNLLLGWCCEALQPFQYQLITDATIAAMESAITSVFIAAEQREEIEHAPKPLVIPIVSTGRCEIVDFPDTAQQAWKTWDKLREKLTRREAEDARDCLLKRLPQFYAADRPDSGISKDHGPITRKMFIVATGQEPQHDDLDRCNCPDAGRPGHYSCGWDNARDKPKFWR